jgi:hypothetical protein
MIKKKSKFDSEIFFYIKFCTYQFVLHKNLESSAGFVDIFLQNVCCIHQNELLKYK